MPCRSKRNIAGCQGLRLCCRSCPGPAGDGSPGRRLSLALVRLPLDRRRDGDAGAYCQPAAIRGRPGPVPGRPATDRSRRWTGARAAQFFRGGPLSVYDGETRQAIAALDGKIDTGAASAVWEVALAATWHGAPVWFHGDVSWGNLLVRQGALSAVIDFGTSGVGDPSCDLAIAWTLFEGKSREVFRAGLQADEATWARGRGWTLWKALITVAGHIDINPVEVEKSRRVIGEVLADHLRADRRGGHRHSA